MATMRTFPCFQSAKIKKKWLCIIYKLLPNAKGRVHINKLRQEKKYRELAKHMSFFNQNNRMSYYDLKDSKWLSSDQQFYNLNKKSSMLETDHQQFVEPQYPAFPVVFQQDLETQFQNVPATNHSRGKKKQPSLSDQEANSLFKLTEKVYETKYPNMFEEQIQNEKHSVENFLKDYKPVNELFVQQMKEKISELSIVRLGSNKIYVGSVKDSKCTGPSIIVFKNGNLYEGEMIDNKRHGKGAFVQPNLGWYVGDFKDDHKSGQGLQIIYHKSAYKGQFINGLRHNIGLYVDDDQNIYEGMWKLGIMHGKGTLKTKKSTYIGAFVNWLKHGTGQQFFHNGDVYRGQYQNGRFDGIGSYQWKAEGGSFYEGNFKNGLRHGKGKWHKGQTKYNGGYCQGLKEGYGELYFPSGNFYKGNFIHDRKQGYGQMFWTDGSFYKGQWKSGTQNGKGQIYLSGGDIVSGIFENSILVQAMPSVYEKQMQISQLSVHDLFGRNQPQIQPPRTRNLSEVKGPVNPRKKLAKISETPHKHIKHVNRGGTGNINGKIYFKSPQKSDHSDGACVTCTKRLENFRLKQQHKRGTHNHSIRQNTKNDEFI